MIRNTIMSRATSGVFCILLIVSLQQVSLTELRRTASRFVSVSFCWHRMHCTICGLLLHTV